MQLNNGLNIIVGNNEAGKSTILEAIHLALTGLSNGKYFKNELSEYFFNNEAVADYKASLAAEKPINAPEIVIEVFIAGDDLPFFEGDGNSENRKECGILLKICLDDKYKSEYEEYIKEGVITAIPIEYYDITWTTKHLRLNELKKDTEEFFEKMPGYDTLRPILCKKAILVTGCTQSL